MATPQALVLASSSPRRQELLRQMGVSFRVVPAELPEAQVPHLSARELCLLHAGRKARAVAKRFPAALVLGADTLVCLGTRVFGKPATLAEARRMLAALEGRTHLVITGVCLLHARSGRRRVFAVVTAVRFRRLSSRQIGRYLRLVNPLDKAGAYAIQEHGDLLTADVRGSRTNVIGLPVERLRQELHAWGWPAGSSAGGHSPSRA